MRLTIPITGTVLVEGTLLNGYLTGDDNDPIRAIDLDLGNVSWEVVSIDIETETMVVDVTPGMKITIDTGQVDGNGKPIYESRSTTQAEKQGFLKYARELVEGKTKDELYTMSKSPRLKRPFKKK